MKYERIEKAVFLERPNRFIAYALIGGQRETIHVKNTGRCAELLKEGAVIYVQESLKPERKTKWDLIAVEKGDRMVNMDSQIPNRVAQNGSKPVICLESLRLSGRRLLMGLEV